MKDTLPGASVECYIDIETPVPAVYFVVSGVNAEDAQTVRQVVDAALAQVAEEGFNQDAVDAIIASTRLDIMLSRESSSVGTDMMPNIAYYWAAVGDVFGYMDFIDSLEQFGDYAMDGTFAGHRGGKTTGLAHAHAEEDALGAEEGQAALAVRREGEEVVADAHIQQALYAGADADFVADRLPVIDIFIAGEIDGAAPLGILQRFFKQRGVAVHVRRQELRGRDLRFRDDAVDQVHAAWAIAEVDVDDAGFTAQDAAEARVGAEAGKFFKGRL